MSEQIWWYATRAAGLMTWSTACASVIVGLLLSTRIVRSRTGPWFLDLHRFLSSVSVIFLITHVGTLWADSYVEFGWRELLIPGESTWKPEAAAWGVIAGWTLIVVQVTSMLRRHISAFVWRLLHSLSFVTVAAGTYHAVLGGSDVDNPVTWIVAGLGSLIVVLLIVVRLRKADPGEPGVRRLTDHESLLVEMRERLENLPVPESTSQPQLTLDAQSALPRRAPVAAEPISYVLEEPRPAEPLSPVAGTDLSDEIFASDPFAAVPVAGEQPDLGSWVGPSGEDPFGETPIDPFRHNEPNDNVEADTAARRNIDPFERNRPFAAADGSTERVDTASADPFDTTPAGEPPPSPFGRPPSGSPFGSETPPPPPVRISGPVGAGADLFAPAGDDEPVLDADDFPELPPFEPGSNPFKPVDPPTSSISVPIEPAPTTPEPTPEPAPAPQAAVAPNEPVPATLGPPPLPAATDPGGGEPDEAVYTAWLVEWLAFAEKYGEETPDDPTRV